MPELKTVFEHITTRQAADYVRTEQGPIAATISQGDYRLEAILKSDQVRAARGVDRYLPCGL